MKAPSESPAGISTRRRNPRKHDLTGRRFFRLVYRKEGPPRHQPSGQIHRRGWCECDCGAVVLVWHVSLLKGSTRSCGCLQRELSSARATTHGRKKSMLYNEWAQIKRRCRDPRCGSQKWRYYGGRGIDILDEWYNSFEAFRAGVLAECGREPGEGESLDRVNNSKGYVPGNLRIADAKIQARNRRNNRLVTFNGETLCVAAWAERTGIPAQTILWRLNAGWSDGRALSRS